MTLRRLGQSHDLIIGSTFRELRRAIHLRKTEYDAIEKARNPYIISRLIPILDTLRAQERMQRQHLHVARTTPKTDEDYLAAARPILTAMRQHAAREFHARRRTGQPLTKDFHFTIHNIDFDATIDIAKHCVYLVAHTTPFVIYKHVMFPRYDVITLFDNPEHWLRHPYYRNKIRAAADSML